MRIWLSSLFLICSAIFSFSSESQLYEAQGQAIIQKGNILDAKTNAMENALKKALLVAGASVSSVQQVVNGLLTQDEISIRASGNVNAIELIDEIHAGNVITVTIRADIFPQEKQCFSADFRKTLLLTRSNLLHREQANIGNIYDIDTASIQVLADKLKLNSNYINAHLSLKNRTEFVRLNQSLNSEKIKQLSISLADQTDSHYILFSEISDLSLNNEATNTWSFWQSSIFERNFAMTFYLYNGTNGELIHERKFNNKAPWSFNKREKIDTASQTFWQSEYGLIVNETLDLIVKDIDENMMCESTQARIVQVSGNKITLNLGSRHGVKIGDEFNLLHKSNFISDAGISYPNFAVSAYKVKISSVSKHSATAVTPDDGLLGNIQIDDLAVRH